jgi:hypothetical protein
VELTEDLRPFGFAQGRLWAIVCRPSGLESGDSFCDFLRPRPF